MVYLLFGEMGVGKNYVGERLARHLRCPFYDGDLSMPDDMKRKVENFSFLPDKVVVRFVGYLVRDIREMSYMYDSIVVSQALYKEKYRRAVRANFPDAEMVHVVSPSLRVHLSRIMARPRGAKWALYFLMSRPFFQVPRGWVKTIVNDTDNSIDKQIKMLVGE